MTIQCPMCGKNDDSVEAKHEWRPFCSRRCKMVDLGNWLGEVYKFSRPIREDDLPEDHALLRQVMGEGDD